MASIFAISLLSSCAKQNYPVATPNDCTRVNALKISKESRAIIDATLILKVDTRRRKYDAEDFCAYNQPTSNGKYYLVTIYDKVGNHMSPTWMLMSRNQVVDTQLNSFEMVSDTSRTSTKIAVSVTRIAGLDEASRKELIQMMKKDALDERK